MKRAKSKVNLKKKAKQVIRMVYIPKNYASSKGRMKLNSINDRREEHQALLKSGMRDAHPPHSLDILNHKGMVKLKT